MGWGIRLQLRKLLKSGGLAKRMRRKVRGRGGMIFTVGVMFYLKPGKNLFSSRCWVFAKRGYTFLGCFFSLRHIIYVRKSQTRDRE